MDDKKQIEEMAYDIYWGCNDLDIITKSGCEGVAEKLYEQGYQNCKDKVVLDKEEWATMHNEYAKALYNARKETAREIIKELWNNQFETTITIQNNCSKEDVENIGKAIIITIRNKLVEFAKQYGVEVE